MPTKPVRRFTAWSYSRLQDWQSCPHYAMLKHLDRRSTPASPAMDRGRAVHKAAEKYVLEGKGPLPEELKLFRDEFAVLRKIRRKVRCELQLGLTSGWQPTDWFGPETWCRVVLDAAVEASEPRIIDYKTGKVNPSHNDQLGLYALAAFMEFPEAMEVQTELWYLDQGELTPRVFCRDEVPLLKEAWNKIVKPMMADCTFKPKPGQACRAYGKPCPFSKSEGGPCQY